MSKSPTHTQESDSMTYCRFAHDHKVGGSVVGMAAHHAGDGTRGQVMSQCGRVKAVPKF